MTVEPRQSGQEAILKIPNEDGEEVPVTNVSWDHDVNTSEVQYTDSLKPHHVVTGLRYSGSFEYDGSNEELRNKLFHDGDEYHEPGEPVRMTMTVREEAGESGQTGHPRTFTFSNVIVTGMSRDVPSDDVSSSSFDWVAEDLEVN